MKKLRNSILIALIALCSISFTSNVNAQSFEAGDFDLNVTIGFGTAWYYESVYKMALPLIAVGADYALIDHWGPGVFGVGGIIGFNSYKYEYFGLIDDIRQNNFSIVPRATYHYQWVDRLDTYGGIGLGFKIRTISGDNLPANLGSETDFVFTIFAGAKYYFTDQFCVMTELCFYDLAFFNIGVGFKF